jgi:hypothetical protein
MDHPQMPGVGQAFEVVSNRREVRPSHETKSLILNRRRSFVHVHVASKNFIKVYD